MRQASWHDDIPAVEFLSATDAALGTTCVARGRQ
jgi:hypothetical protein